MDLQLNGEKFQKETFSSRWDRTRELTASKDKRKETRWKRRLDSIARLIENASICAAIAVHDSSFLIATNKEFPAGENTKDQGYVLINTVMNFFKKVAEGANSEENFKEVFEAICDGAMAGLQISVYKKKLFAEAGFLDKLRQAGKDEATAAIAHRDFLSQTAEIEGHYPKDQGAAFDVCLALFKDLEKVIKFIKTNRESDDPQITAFISAIRGYSESDIITKNRLVGKICGDGPEGSIKAHAEMKIMACLEDQLKGKKKYENYVGVSKLCCMDCHAIIHAVNAAHDYNNQIEIRGAHNVRYPGEWTAPFMITGNAQSLSPPVGKHRRDEPEPFIDAIVKSYKGTYKENPIPVTGLPQHHDDSQPSSEDEIDEKVAIDEFISILQSKKEQLLQLTKSKVSGITISLTIFKAIELLLQDANKIRRLQSWLRTGASDDIIGYLASISEQYALDVDFVKKIKEILSDEQFVGKIAASRFSMVLKTLEAVQGKQKGVEHDSEARETQLAINYAKDLTELGQRDFEGLQVRIFKTCTGEDFSSQKVFADALNLLSQEQLGLMILQSLELQTRHKLIQMLNSPPFAGEKKYNQLRVAAKEIQTTAFMEILTSTWMANEGEGLLAVINDLRIGKLSLSVKEEFLDTLRIMEPAKHAELRSILEAISRNHDLSSWLLTEIEGKFSTSEHREFITNVGGLLGIRQSGVFMQQQTQQQGAPLQQMVEKRLAPEGGKEPDPRETKKPKTN